MKRCWSIPFNGLHAEFQKNELKIFSLRSVWIFDEINQMLINAGVVPENAMKFTIYISGRNMKIFSAGSDLVAPSGF